uniref:Uncharacterized protein n=1 Tax=Fibrocapsa japonica TaxID=94617 RepID=A0A7S2UUK3_9STRA|mmetsp:Transcript_14136/g.20825  ORF Transcript_14136/g.20825 Transcript_14136/m.20825 type:complete len:611 (+) Transcript_14136:86-1918(+)
MKVASEYQLASNVPTQGGLLDGTYKAQAKRGFSPFTFGSMFALAITLTIFSRNIGPREIHKSEKDISLARVKSRSLEGEERLPPNYVMYTNDFFEHPKVIEAFQKTEAYSYLTKHHVDETDPDEIARGRKHIREQCFGPGDNIDIYINEDLVKNDLVDEYGLTVFNLDCRDLDAVPLIAFIVLMDTYGNVIDVHNPPNRAESVAMYDPDTVLFSCVGDNGAWLWNFKEDTVEMLPFIADQHTLVYDPVEELFYGLERASNYDASICAAWNKEGEEKWRLAFPEGSSHINYLTIDGTYAYVSLRGQSAIAKVNLKTEEEVLRVGSMETTVGILGIDGKTLLKDKHDVKNLGSFWYRQHKGQQLSDRYWSLFDNHCEGDKTNFVDDGTSHLVVIDVKDDPAKVVFYFDTGDQSKIYGGADVVPSGNVLGNSWDAHVDPTDWDRQYHVNLWEVAPNNDVAWRMSFRGLNPWDPTDFESTHLHTSEETEEAPVGWIVYNTERIYYAPVLSTPCKDSKGIKFMAFNSIRTQRDMPGSAYLARAGTDGDEILSKVEIQLQKAYIPREVVVPLDGVEGEVDLIVANSWDQTKLTSLGDVSQIASCADMPDNGRIFID